MIVLEINNSTSAWITRFVAGSETLQKVKEASESYDQQKADGHTRVHHVAAELSVNVAICYFTCLISYCCI